MVRKKKKNTRADTFAKMRHKREYTIDWATCKCTIFQFQAFPHISKWTWQRRNNVLWFPCQEGTYVSEKYFWKSKRLILRTLLIFTSHLNNLSKLLYSWTNCYTRDSDIEFIEHNCIEKIFPLSSENISSIILLPWYMER